MLNHNSTCHLTYPAIPPNAYHECTSDSVGADTTISYSPPTPSVDLTSPDILKPIAANANSHLQMYERSKLGLNNKTDPKTSIVACGDTLIGNRLERNMLLIPFVTDPFGRLGPFFHNFLFGHHPAFFITFSTSRSNATAIYSILLQFPSPKGIFHIADHTWSNTPTHRIYGHSYLAPTPFMYGVISLFVWFQHRVLSADGAVS
jgi:hypothetical protein